MKLPTHLTIQIHSFVDLITNSSSEIFVNADGKTLESIKLIVDNVLKMGGSTLRADDLFEFALVDDPDGYHKKVQVMVKSKDTASSEGATVGKLLSDLTSLFSIDAEYNG